MCSVVLKEKLFSVNMLMPTVIWALRKSCMLAPHTTIYVCDTSSSSKVVMIHANFILYQQGLLTPAPTTMGKRLADLPIPFVCACVIVNYSFISSHASWSVKLISKQALTISKEVALSHECFFVIIRGGWTIKCPFGRCLFDQTSI